MVLKSKSVHWYHIIRNGVSEGPSYDITIASCFSQRIHGMKTQRISTAPRHHQRSTGWWRLNDVIQQYWTEKLLWYTPSNKRNLLGGLPTPLKNMSQLGWWNSQYMEKSKTCSKAPTRNVPWQHVSMSEPAQKLKNLWDSRSTPMKNNKKMVWFKFPKQHWKLDYSYPNKKKMF